MHTEDEATTLLCPFQTRAANDSTESGNNRCKGSQCMAWRWVVSSQDETHYLGYCGLAGKPFN